MADTQVKDDISLAVKVLKSLIPKSNPSYAQIMKNIDEILSHPTNTTLNKELGTFILNAIKDDNSIENKDKNIIKSQLQVIIYGGQNNIPKTTPAPEETGGSGGILGFLAGFGKVLGFILLIIIGLVLALFVYFKASNKDDNLGFQDFIIDKFSGKHPGSKPSSSQPVSTAPAWSPEKEQKTSAPVDVLANIPSDRQTPKEEEKKAPFVSEETESGMSSFAKESASIPDWLKQSTALGSLDQEAGEAMEKLEMETEKPIPSAQSADESAALTPEVPSLPTASSEVTAEAPSVPEDTGIPDWLKGIPTGPEPSQQATAPEESVQQPEEESSQAPSQEGMKASASEEGVPAWLQGMDQESIKQEVEEEMTKTSSVQQSEEKLLHEDIPDWLKGTSATPEEPKKTEIFEEAPKSTDETDDVIPDWLKGPLAVSEEPKTELLEHAPEAPKQFPTEEPENVPEEPKTSSVKKSSKVSAKKESEKVPHSETPAASDSASSPEQQKEDHTAVAPRPKKKKPTPPTVSEGPNIPATDDELPDWLK